MERGGQGVGKRTYEPSVQRLQPHVATAMLLLLALHWPCCIMADELLLPTSHGVLRCVLLQWVRIFFQSIFDIVDDYPLTQVGYLLLASGIMYLYLRPQADDDEDEAMTSPQTGPIASSSPTLGSSSTLSR